MKIRYLHTLQFPKIFNLYKLSRRGNLIIGEDNLVIKSSVHHIVIQKVLGVSRVNTGNLNFKTWIKVEYETKGGKVQEIFMMDRRWFRDSTEIFDLMLGKLLQQ